MVEKTIIKENMEQIISKEEFDGLMKIKGEVKGVAMKENMEFILKEEGEEGLRKLEDQMANLGQPIEYRKIKSMIFYPLCLDAVLLLVIKRLFNYNDRKFQEMGRFEPKISFIIRIFMKYFVSLEKAAKEVSKMWRQTFTVGDLKVGELNKEKRYGRLRLENYRLIPIQCQILQGYFPSVLQMIVGSDVSCQETKCVHRGDEYCEFFLKW